MPSYFGRWILYALPVLLLSIGSPVLAQADQTTKTFEERKHERADTLRQQSLERARSQLGFEEVYPGKTNRYIDFWALSAQAARLGALLDAALNQMGGPMAGYGQQSFVPPGPTVDLAPQVPSPGYLRAIYGPDGPTVRSVTALLGYRLVVVGNPHLKAGKVTENEKDVVAEIVTKDGSLVEKYFIDKRTGQWKPER